MLSTGHLLQEKGENLFFIFSTRIVESLLGIFSIIAISFLHPCGDHLFSQILLFWYGWVGRVSPKGQVGNLFGDQALYRAFLGDGAFQLTDDADGQS